MRLNPIQRAVLVACAIVALAGIICTQARADVFTVDMIVRCKSDIILAGYVDMGSGAYRRGCFKTAWAEESTDLNDPLWRVRVSCGSLASNVAWSSAYATVPGVQTSGYTGACSLGGSTVRGAGSTTRLDDGSHGEGAGRLLDQSRLLMIIARVLGFLTATAIGWSYASKPSGGVLD